MQLYEIADFRCHTPLSGAEIAKLFRAGRLHRDAKCKAVDAPRWRTVDELFPLLKYDSSGPAGYAVDEDHHRLTARHLVVAVAATLLAAVSAFALFLLYQGSVAPTTPARASTAIDPPVRPTANVNTTPDLTLPSHANVAVPRVQQPRSAPPVVHAPAAHAVDAESDRRLARERHRREQEQRDRAVAAARLREKNAREAAEKQRGEGHDTILPLDQYGSVYVGGSWVSVKVHDNDVTSFDAWVNGAFYDDLRKEKGLNGSRTDETLIYTNGRASLYYAWELSGKLNHCRLRVREH